MIIQYILLDDLLIKDNVRAINPESPDIHELAQSMQENGQEVEIRVYEDPDGNLVLKSGHRRVMAAKLLGWRTIRAILEVEQEDEATRLIEQTIENEHRVGMGYLDKARVFLRLKELGWSQREVAQRFGVSDSEVSLALSTLRATPKLQQAVEDGRIKPSALEPLLSQPLEVQEVLADAAIQEKTVRRVAALVQAHKTLEASNKMTDQDDREDEDYDATEYLAMGELEEALEHIRTVRTFGIRHPNLVRAARPKVEELIKQAALIKLFLDGEVWDDVADLV